MFYNNIINLNLFGYLKEKYKMQYFNFIELLNKVVE